MVRILAYSNNNFMKNCRSPAGIVKWSSILTALLHPGQFGQNAWG